MDIHFWEPLNRGWIRTKQALFQPLDLKKWFVVGFTAFLAGLSDYGGETGFHGKSTSHFDWDELMYFPQNTWDWLKENPEWFTLIIMGLVLLIIFMVVIIWLSSRGKFMFLDNVVYNRVQVVKPWREYKAQGDSLFYWNIVFVLLVLTIFISYLVNCYSYLYDLYTGSGDGRPLIVPLIWMLIGLVGLILVVGFIDMALVDFIVPIMYRYRIRTNEAWSMFLPLFYARLWYFLGYALFKLIITILVAIAVILAGLFTCCLGFLLLMVPYINSVVLLPVSYTLRAFSVEFLEQFGTEYRIFPGSAVEVKNG